MKIEKKLFGTEIERYFESYADGLAAYKNGEIYCISVEIDTTERTATYNTQNKTEYMSNSSNNITQEDGYEEVMEKLIYLEYKNWRIQCKELEKDGITTIDCGEATARQSFSEFLQQQEFAISTIIDFEAMHELEKKY